MRRGRLMLLTLLAFAWPTAGLANSVDYDSGTFKSGTMMGNFNTGIDVTVAGTLAKVIIDTGTLTLLPSKECHPSGYTCYSFTAGSVIVDKGGRQVFKDSLSGGLTIHDGNVVGITAAISPETGVLRGTASANFVFQGVKIVTGDDGVSYTSPTAVPEPTSLLSLGSGLIGLAGMRIGRKLKLRT